MILRLEHTKAALENDINNSLLYIKLIEKYILNRINPDIYKSIFSKIYKQVLSKFKKHINKHDAFLLFRIIRCFNPKYI